MKPESISEQMMFNTVRLETASGTGTGFFYNFVVGEATYPTIITNKHVVNYKQDENVKFHLHLQDGDGESNSSIGIELNAHWYFHSTKDICFTFVNPVFEQVKATCGKKVFYIGPAFPESMIPEDVKEILESDNYELMLIMNEYAVASDEVNSQLSEINTILKQYDPTGMLVGEAPCTKDLIEITDHDFAVVSAVSILAVFFIIFFVFKSISLPVILVMVIEGAIFINMGIPFLTGTKLPFIASIVIGTIQLGATVDYAILITSRYEKERGEGKSKKDAIQIAHKTSIRPVMVSAFSFFAATFGVGMYSQIDMISSLCLLMARGALISMCAVLLFLPAMFWLFDGIICKTSLNFRRKH